MILQGGDTDTNAAIVGGLLGARYGLHDPKELEWRDKVLSYDFETADPQGHLRPEFLRPTHLNDLIERVFSNAP